MTNKLNYDNATALINAFKQGAKFKLTHLRRAAERVSRIEAGGEHGLFVWGETTGRWGAFRPDGTHAGVPGFTMIRDESLGFERTSVTVGDSVFGWVPPPKATPVPEKPLLQRLLQGEVFHNPKTRETVESFTFSKNTLVVTLKGEDGSLRNSERYDHNGKHKWRPERSLVAGPVPPKVPAVIEYTARQLEDGSAPAGVYKVSTNVTRESRFIALGSPSYRAVLYVYGFRAEKMTPKAWSGYKFVKTDETASGLLSTIRA